MKEPSAKTNTITNKLNHRDERKTSCMSDTTTTSFDRSTSKKSQLVNRKRINIEVQTESSGSSVEIVAADSRDEYMTAKDGDSCYYSVSSDRSGRDQDDVEWDDEAGTPMEANVDHNWTVETLYSSNGELSFKLGLKGGASMILYVDEVLFTLRAITESSRDDVFKVVSSMGDAAFLTNSEVVDYIGWLVEAFSHHAARQAAKRRTTKRRKQSSKKTEQEGAMNKQKISRKTAHPPIPRKSRKGQDEAPRVVSLPPRPSHLLTKSERSRATPINCMLRFVSNRRHRSLVKSS